MRLTPHDHQLVTSAVAEAELGTDGEIVAIVAPRSDRYHDVAAHWAVLAMLAMAGLQGLREELPTPRPTEGDLSTMAAAELKAQGVRRLPTSLPLALAALDADPTAKSWLPPLLLECYRKHKQNAIAAMAGLSDAEHAARYAKVY